MNYDKKCKWHKSCGYDFCHGEGICPEFEKGKPTKETKKGVRKCPHEGKRVDCPLKLVDDKEVE